MEQPLNRLGAPDSGKLCWKAIILMLLVITVSTVFPRLMVLGDLPSTDEGYSAYIAQLTHSRLSAGQGLSGSDTLLLYPILVSWVFNLGGNAIIWLRFVDLVVAVVASALFFKILLKESRSTTGSALIALVFLFTMNQPLFIQSGYKNSIFAAYIPMFLAVLIGQSTKRHDHTKWGVAGGLIALAVLLRETFVPFAILGTLTLFFGYGWPASLRFISGGVITGLIILTCLIIGRDGSLSNLIQSYREIGNIYAFIEHPYLPLFITNGRLAAAAASVPLILGGLTIIWSFFTYKSSNLGCLIFWLSFAVIPLLEPASKIGFPYHFSVCLPGIAGLVALGWRQWEMENTAGLKRHIPALLVSLGALCLVPKVFPLAAHCAPTWHTLQSFHTGSWPTDVISKSNYLLAADAIKKVAPVDGTLSVSGFMYALFPLTNMLPPTQSLSNLSFTLLNLNLEEAKLKQAILNNPPDIIITTTRADWPGRDSITRVVIDSGLYMKVTEIPLNPEISYGVFGGAIYRKTSQPSLHLN